jgi:hypothetical protein
VCNNDDDDADCVCDDDDDDDADCVCDDDDDAYCV